MKVYNAIVFEHEHSASIYLMSVNIAMSPIFAPQAHGLGEQPTVYVSRGKLVSYR